MANSRLKTAKVARLQRPSREPASERARGRSRKDPVREDRITMEVVVDAYDAAERAMGWFGYLENELEFPFTAHCTGRRAISPLLVGDEVEVISMAPAGECAPPAVGQSAAPNRRLQPSAADAIMSRRG